MLRFNQVGNKQSDAFWDVEAFQPILEPWDKTTGEI